MGDRTRQGEDAPGAGEEDRARPTRSALECAERLAQTGSWDWDLGPDVLLWSDNMFRLLGLEPGAVTPTPEYVIEQTHPDDRPRVEAEIEAARRQGIPPDVTYRVVLPDGRIRVLRGATTAVAELSDGRPSRLIGSVQDLTDAVEAQRKMAESLTLMEAMQSGAPVGFAFVDTDFRIVQINQTLAEVNGSPAEEQVGKTVAEVVPDVWAQMQPVYERVLSSGEAEVNLEVERERGKTGDLRSWLSSYYPVRVEGEVIGLGVIVIDITDRTEAEHFRAAVMDTIVEGLYVLDQNGRLKFMNPAAAKLLGWSEEELRGRSMHEAIHHQHADGSPHPEEECELLKVRTERRAVQMMHEAFTAKDGTIIPVSYSAAPLMRGTSLDGVVVVFRDRSEEQAREEQARRELDTLAWVGRIRDAFDQGRMVLYSQPIVPLAGGRPSEELLLRMLGAEGRGDPSRQLPAGRGALRVDRRDRPLGDRPGGPPRRHRLTGRGQPLGPVDGQLRPAAVDRTRTAGGRRRPRQPRLRDHRDGVDGQRRGRRSLRQGPQRDRLPDRPRRFRHRLRQLHLPEDAADHLPQDRRRLRPRPGEERGQPAPGPGDRGSRRRFRLSRRSPRASRTPRRWRS